MSDYDHALTDGGHVVQCGDADEELIVPDAELSDLESIHAIRETAYIRHCRNRAGEIIEEKAFTESQEARERLEESTIDLAFKLHQGGRSAFSAKGAPVVFIVCPETGRFHLNANVKSRNFFPTEAKKKRAKTLAALELILGQKDHRFDQFVTFTHGKNVPLEPAYQGPCLPKGMDRAGYRVNRAFKDLHWRIKELNKQRFMKFLGAEIIFRSSETGALCEFEMEAGEIKRNAKGQKVYKRDENGKKLVKRDRAGRVMVHPHGHCILHLPRFQPKSAMRYLTGRIWQYFGTHWSIDGALQNIQEVAKYAFKAEETDALSPAEVCMLDEALFNLHRVQPMGELRDQITYRRRYCLTIKREFRLVTNKAGKRERRKILVVVPDWNARKKNRIAPPKSPVLRHREARKQTEAELSAHLRQLTEKRRLAGFDTVEVGETPDFLRRPADSPADYVSRGDRIAAETAPETSVNRVLARLGPAPYFDRIARPALVVMNYDGNLKALQELPFVADFMEVVRPLIKQAEEKLRVHTSPVLGGAKPEFLPWRDPESHRTCRSRPQRTPNFAN